MKESKFIKSILYVWVKLSFIILSSFSKKFFFIGSNFKLLFITFILYISIYEENWEKKFSVGLNKQIFFNILKANIWGV